MLLKISCVGSSFIQTIVLCEAPTPFLLCWALTVAAAPSSLWVCVACAFKWPRWICCCRWHSTNSHKWAKMVINRSSMTVSIDLHTHRAIEAIFFSFCYNSNKCNRSHAIMGFCPIRKRLPVNHFYCDHVRHKSVKGFRIFAPLYWSILFSTKIIVWHCVWCELNCAVLGENSIFDFRSALAQSNNDISIDFEQAIATTLLTLQWQRVTCVHGINDVYHIT